MANVGFWGHNQHHRKGYAREMIAAAMRIGHDLLADHRIEAALRLDNAPAISAVGHGRMPREGVRRRLCLDPDGWADHVIYVASAP